MGLQVSRPRPIPGQNELECTRVSRPWSRDHNTAIYAHTLCWKTTKFDVVTNVGSGVYLGVSHASHPKRAYPGLPSFRGSPVCMRKSVDAEPNDQIQHGNTCGEGRYYVRHAIASAQFLVLLANYVYIYSLIIRKNYDFFLLVCFNSPFELCLGTSQTCIKSSNSQVQVKSTSFKSKSKTAKTT